MELCLERPVGSASNSEDPDCRAWAIGGMNAQRLLAHFDRVVDAPDAVPRLRRFVLDLAVRGKLVEQDPADEPALELLTRISSGKATLKRETGDRRIKQAIDPQKDDYPVPLPVTWQVQCFGNLFLFIDYRGKTPPKTNDGIPLITAKNVRSGVLNREPREFIDEATYSTWMTRGLPQIGDLFFTSEAPLGNVCQNDIEEPFALAQRVICLRPFGKINTRYLMFAIMSNVSQTLIREHSTGLTAKGIKSAKLKLLPIPVPPLEEQYRIATRVDELMALCNQLDQARAAREATRNRLSRASYARLSVSHAENTTFRSYARFAVDGLSALTARADQVKRLRQTILDLAVRGKLVEQDPTDEPASELLKRIAVARTKAPAAKKGRSCSLAADLVDIDLSDLPTSWKWVSIGTAFLYDAGIKRDPRALDPSCWLLELGDIEKDTGRLISKVRSAERASKSTKSEFQPGDILYGKLRPYLNKVLVADEQGYSTTEIVAIRPYVSFCSEYCALALRRPDFVKYVTKLGQGTKMPRLRTKDAIVAPFPLPPLAEQHRIVAKVGELMVLCDRLEAGLGTVDSGNHCLVESLLREALQPTTGEMEEAKQARCFNGVRPRLVPNPTTKRDSNFRHSQM